MRFAGPILEKAMIDHTYACRPGKGPLQAVYHALANLEKYPWYVKIDIKKYFETICHAILLDLLKRKFKGDFFHDLVGRIVQGYSTTEGRGLPIGSLTSQHFANYYLDGLDRLITEQTVANAYVRYMDDMVWWCSDKETAKTILRLARYYAQERLSLTVKDNEQIQRSSVGMTFCGFRVLPGRLRLTLRKKQRYAKRRSYWERLYAESQIDAFELQRAYDSVKAIIAHSSSMQWMQKQMALRPSPEV
jgi:RNA-directed DNA polymerase